MPTLDEVMRQLEEQGTEQNRKIYRRHGVPEPMFGVSYAALGALRKQIKTDHELARGLWATGNHDARILATMVADPRRVDEPLIEAWAADLRCHALTDAFVQLVARTPAARVLAERWASADDEQLGRAGWHLLGQLALHDPALPDAYFEPYLRRIATEIHTRKNRVREAMNNTLIAIGTRSEQLEQAALATAAAIGPVQVDHGETNCKTPDAAVYIRKARARQRQREERSAASR
ncbi:MAG TPA: DNA alkylation repair protein [Roseiflexaceae bacterium]|nr:DNA alkylation repair protein [Roseiflexaceae bacterium]